MKLNYENIELLQIAENKSFICSDSIGFPPFVRGNLVFREKVNFVKKSDIQQNIEKEIYLLDSFTSYKEIIFYLKKIVESTKNNLYLKLNNTFFEENSLESIALIRAIRGFFSVFTKKLYNNTLQIYFIIELDNKNLKYLPFIIGSEIDFIVNDYINNINNQYFTNVVDIFAGATYIENKTMEIFKGINELL